MKIYRNTLTPVRTKKLIALAKNLGIFDARIAKPGAPRYHQTPRKNSLGETVIRIAIYCHDDQYEKLSQLYRAGDR